jgi:UDP-N-acetylmuramate: L-alanyl-gamma-D-glutamyl-meso-diaminopimelate ligase
VTYITRERIPLQIFGKHNYKNMQGASEVAAVMGIPKSDFYRYMSDFKGASRRLEILARGAGVLIRDFAHVPSKVRGSIEAVMEQFADKILLAVLELHTYSSLNKDFITHYKGSLDIADKAVVYYDPEAIKLKRMPALNDNMLKEAFGREDLILVNRPEELVAFLQAYPPEGSVVLMMSSGSFGGLDWKKLSSRFR